MRIDEASKLDFAERALARLERIPGVSSVGLADFLPISGRVSQAVSIVAEGRPRQAGEEELLTQHAVSSEYLATLGVPLIAGRSFTAGKARDGADVVVLSSGVVSRLWDDGSGLGRRVRVGDSPQWKTVVGVTADIDLWHRLVSFARIPEIQAHVPYGSVRDRRIAIVVRGDQPLSALAPLIRNELYSLDATLPVPEVVTMDQAINQVQWMLGYFTRVLTLYAFLALLISALGTYGVAADSVAQRRREMAIRKALGARSLDVYGLVIRQGTVLAVIGIGVGCSLGYLVVQFIAGMLFGVSPRDPLVFIGAALLMASVSVLASLIPARNANKVDLLDSLRA